MPSFLRNNNNYCVVVVYAQRDQQGTLLQNCEQGCWLLLETIYLQAVGTKILHRDAKGTFTSLIFSLNFVHIISQKGWNVVSKKV